MDLGATSSFAGRAIDANGSAQSPAAGNRLYTATIRKGIDVVDLHAPTKAVLFTWR